MSKQVTKKSLFVCLVISLVLIVAGAFMFGFLGFNADSTGSDYTVVQVSDFSFSIRSEETQQQLTDFCSEEISKTYSVSGVEQFTDTSTGEVLIRYTVEGAPDQTYCAQLETTIVGAGIEGISDTNTITVTYHDVVNRPYTQYIWRTAIGAAVVLVILFAYVAIRFKVGMGVATLVAAVHDMAVTLAVVALLRIPAGVSLIGAVVAALLLSAAMNMFVYGRMRKDFRSDEMKALPAREAVAASVRGSRKGVFTIAVAAAAFIVVLGVVGIFTAFDLTSFMLSALIAVVASTYSSLLLSPAIYACIKEKSDANRAKKAKYDYASEKKRAKDAKAAAKAEPAGETR